MRYNQLGRTGLTVSEFCLGTMSFGRNEGHWIGRGQAEQPAVDEVVAIAVEAGVNFFDTANIYGAGRSEERLGQAIHNLGLAREDVVIATKVLGRVGPGINSMGLSRLHIMDAVKASLKRLKTDHIDLYQVHGFDEVTPVEETVRALDDLVKQGHIRYVGCSNWAAWQIMKAHAVSKSETLARFESLQAYYSIAGRGLERELAPMLLSENVGLMIWSPLAGGFLSGRYTRDGEGEGRRSSFEFPPVNNEAGYDIVDVMRPMAAARDANVAQIALAWLLHQRAVTSVIIGVSNIEQLHDNLGAGAIMLKSDELAALDEVSKLPAEYPGWMLGMQQANRAIPGADPSRWK